MDIQWGYLVMQLLWHLVRRTGTNAETGKLRDAIFDHYGDKLRAEDKDEDFPACPNGPCLP